MNKQSPLIYVTKSGDLIKARYHARQQMYGDKMRWVVEGAGWNKKNNRWNKTAHLVAAFDEQPTPCQPVEA